MTLDIIAKCKLDADAEIEKMRGVAAELFNGREDIIIGVNGSVARREYTSGSDVDHFFLSTTEDEIGISSEEDEFREALLKAGLKMPAAGGVFEGALPQGLLLSPIGGDDDSNKTLTRRMLFLLEGEWIFNQSAFETLRKELVEQYVSTQLEDEKLALYLLNDIIRYWRTICIDFEHKTAKGDKPRALRLAKLRMSRMLLCFAGMVAVAEADNEPPERKRSHLVDLFSQQGLDRLDRILDEDFSQAKTCYSKFLSKLDDPSVRAQLNSSDNDVMQTELWDEMTKLAREFKAELVSILINRYKTDSKLVKAMLL